MRRIDLHTHSTASDGSFSPAKLIDLACSIDLAAIALTDHDTIGGIKEAKDHIKQKQITSLTFISGIEMSCHYKGTELHILGYHIDENNEILNTKLASIITNRDARNEKMIQKMHAYDIPVTLADLQDGNEETVVTRAHFAKYLIKNGYVSSKDEAFTKYLSKGCPFYEEKVYFSPKECIDVIHAAGGTAFLAHPFLYGFSQTEISSLLGVLSDLGLDGVEVYHPSSSVSQSLLLKEYVTRYHLSYSGGSDFHGTNKPDISLGIGTGKLFVPEDLLTQLL